MIRNTKPIPSRPHDGALLESAGDLLGVLEMALEDLQTGLQQALELGVAGGRISVVSSAPSTVLW